MRKLIMCFCLFMICLFIFNFNVKADQQGVTDFSGKICSYADFNKTDDTVILYAVISQSKSVISFPTTDESINVISNWSTYISEKKYSVQCPKYLYKIVKEPSDPNAYATDNKNSIPENTYMKYRLIEGSEHKGAFCHYLRNDNIYLNVLMDVEEERIVNPGILGENVSKKLSEFAKISMEKGKNPCHAVVSCGDNYNIEFGVDLFDFDKKKLKDCEKYFSSTDKEKENDTCIAYETHMTNYEKALDELKNCKDSVCELQKQQRVKSIKENWKANCKSILEYGAYIDVDNCVVMCLGLSDYLAESDNADTGECGFSGRLMVWFSNILRWIKYLLPVAVIVLAILDFIKAIGADKDDEMKKAQGRFVKRLIAAALVFIIPLIIEFILDKMGFGYDDCGLF